MNASELREKSIDELKKLENEQRSEYVKLKFRHEAGQLEKSSELNRVAKNVARILTVIREKRQEKRA